MYRREFLTLPFLTALSDTEKPSCIVLRMRGGPSHLDTFDPKPDAPSDIRGPFRPIKTNVAGIEISEVLPLTASHADKFTIIRSVHHDETTHSAAKQLFALPAHPRLRIVDLPGWDIHGWGPFGGFASHRDTAAQTFDRTFSSLLAQLHGSGTLTNTLVVALGEFGRTPKINPDLGRDHWPHCFSVVIAGGGVRGGEICGSSDRFGAEPRDTPTAPATIVAAIGNHLSSPADYIPGR